MLPKTLLQQKYIHKEEFSLSFHGIMILEVRGIFYQDSN